jgi:hypothetical protein
MVGGADLYDIQTQLHYQQEIIGDNVRDYLLPYRNLPIVAVAFVPFTYLDIYYSWVFFTLANLGIVVTLIYTTTRKLPKHKALIITFGTFAFVPIVITLILGQLSIILLLIFALIYKQLEAQRSLYTGILAGLLFIKLPFILAIPFIFLLTRDKKPFLTGLLLSFIVLMFGSLLISGSIFIRDYLSFIATTEVPTYGSYHTDMFSIGAALLSRGLSFGTALGVSMIVYLVILTAFVLLRKSLNLKIAFSFVLLAPLVSGIHVLFFDLSVLASLPVAFLLQKSHDV